MKKCPFCAENIQDVALKCRYCGEWLGKNMHDSPGNGCVKKTGTVGESKLVCPKCNVNMKSFKRGGARTDECQKCGGIWVNRIEEKQVLEMKPAVFTVDELRDLKKVYKPLGKMEKKVRYYKCPHCGKLMWRKNYMQHSGIVVEKCRDHGTFFDKGELEKAIEFIKKGGTEYEKLRISEIGISETQSKLVREIGRLERTMYRLHWIGRFLSFLGF